CSSIVFFFFFFSSRRRHTRLQGDWSSDVCSSDLSAAFCTVVRRARLLRDRLTTVQKAAEREPTEELAILRDEMLSEIPALDTLRSEERRVGKECRSGRGP